MKIRYVLALAVALVSTPVLAFDDADKAAVGSRFDTLFADMKAHRYAGVFKAMPPKFVKTMAEQSNMDVDTMLNVLGEQMQQALDKVELEDASYDMAQAKTGATEAGRDYAVVPTRTIVNAKGTRVEATSPMLALKEDGQWYVIRLDAPDQFAALQAVYPDLAGVEIPPAQAKKLD